MPFWWLSVQAVRIISPPVGVKDAREWKRRGATAADVQAAIDAAPVRKLAVSVSQKEGMIHMEADNGLTIDYVRTGRNGSATLTAKLGGDVLAVEKLDLTKPKQRADFAGRLCEGRPGIDAAAVESELLRLAADLAAKPETPAETAGKPDAAVLLEKMPEAARIEARNLLEAPDLMQRVVEDIGLLGVAGEKELAATVYLVGTSRLLPEPLAGIVQGPSSSGKSYVIRKAVSLFPPEAVIVASQLTPQSLFYMEPGSLVHRFIVAGERSRLENDDTAEATRALREMLSEGRLSKLLPVKNRWPVANGFG